MDDFADLIEVPFGAILEQLSVGDAAWDLAYIEGGALRFYEKYPVSFARPHVRLSMGRPVSQYAGNEGCTG